MVSRRTEMVSTVALGGSETGMTVGSLEMRDFFPRW